MDGLQWGAVGPDLQSLPLAIDREGAWPPSPPPLPFLPLASDSEGA